MLRVDMKNSKKPHNILKYKDIWIMRIYGHIPLQINDLGELAT